MAFGIDPTMRAPGFFENAAFPLFNNANLDGSLSILPMEAPLFPQGGGLGTGAAPNTLFGFKLDKNGLPQLGADAQKNYFTSIMASYFESAKQLQAGFAAFLGPAVQPK